MSAAPSMLSMQQTGFAPPIPTFQPQQTGFQQPQQTGFGGQPQGFQPQQTGFQPQQQQGFMQPQATGFGQSQNSFYSQPQQQQQQQPVQFNPMPPSATGATTVASSSGTHNAPTNVFASMREGTFAKGSTHLPAQDANKYDALRPQQTGFGALSFSFAPPMFVRAGLTHPLVPFFPPRRRLPSAAAAATDDASADRFPPTADAANDGVDASSTAIPSSLLSLLPSLTSSSTELTPLFLAVLSAFLHRPYSLRSLFFPVQSLPQCVLPSLSVQNHLHLLGTYSVTRM